MPPSLDIILVNRNSGRELLECLSSVRKADKNAFVLRRVCVVDDASTDQSAAGLSDLRLPLEIMRNSEHTGYGASCNRAARNSAADYILFLNTDCVLFADSLDKPLAYMEQARHAGVGIVGIQLLDAQGGVARSCAQFPTPVRMISTALGLDHLFPSLFPSHQMKRWNHLETREVDQVIGAFMLMRRVLFDRLGGYDERFFVYMEDLDLSLRMRRLGYTSVYLASAQAVHQGGGTARRARSESLFFALRSQIQYAFKHFGRVRGGVVAAVVLCLEPVARALLAASRQREGELQATAEAYRRLWTEMLWGRLSGGTCHSSGTRKRNRSATSDDSLMKTAVEVNISEGGNR